MICYQFYRFIVQRMGTFLSLDLLSTRWMRRWDARRQRLAEFVFCGISVRRTDDIEMENPIDEEVWRKSVSCMTRWNRFLQALTWAGANSEFKATRLTNSSSSLNKENPLSRDRNIPLTDSSDYRTTGYQPTVTYWLCTVQVLIRLFALIHYGFNPHKLSGSVTSPLFLRTSLRAYNLHFLFLITVSTH